MFGSKLRSWMENHIVRPRKKGGKNKSAASNVGSSSSSGLGSHEGLRKSEARGFTIYHGNGATTTTTTSFGPGSAPCGAPGAHPNGCSSVISSPVRRREVSPIQSHAQSRYGWQSPDQDAVMSPKSDNFLYAPQHHRVRPGAPAPQSQPQQQQQQHQADCSSSSFSSLSWSTGSKEPSMQSSHHSNNSNNSNNNNGRHSQTLPEAMQRQSSATSASTSPPPSSLDRSPEDLVELRRGPRLRAEEDPEDPDAVHYEEIRTLVRRPPPSRPQSQPQPQHQALYQQNLNRLNNNHNHSPSPSRQAFEYERPKSDQFATGRGDETSARYGRLLPSKMLASSADSLNANHLQAGPASAEGLPVNHYSNNNHQPAAPATGTYSVRGAGGGAGLASRTKLRTARFGAPAAGPGQGPGAPLNSLSSPESAYSTGYSTDGTSPGAAYAPPEYYINMRTGTHYFPRSVNSLAVEAQRYRFGLNKIEEMSPQEPLPTSSFGGGGPALFRRADGSEPAPVPGFGVPDPEFCRGQMQLLEPQRPPLAVGCHSPLSIRNTIVLPTLKGFESPSPRQRCRIRTNPWYSTTDTSSSGATVVGAAPPHHQQQQQQVYAAASTTSSSKSSASSMRRLEAGSSSTCSSGRKSGSEADAAALKGLSPHERPPYDSGSSSSLTEVENVPRSFTPTTVRRKRATELPVSVSVPVSLPGASAPPEPPASDDDATLNEMMGKFDESYVYEKETDILSSDSDPTDCPSDLDTGQDAGDECDTDELLDIDFIDTASIQEVCDRRDSLRNLGSCSYYSQNQSPVRPPLEGRGSVRSRRNSRGPRGASQEPSQAPQPGGGSQRRRKRFLKTRKKSSEGRAGGASPVRSARESRSVGGTPVCLRRNPAAGRERGAPRTPCLGNRSSSLVFTDPPRGPGRCVAIAESEKALLAADLEADVKYRQLIHEAEAILVSMKSSVLSIPRDTPAASPRRVNPLANKRVEMLKQCEPDPKRAEPKQQQQQQQKQRSQEAAEQEFVAGVNRRIEKLRGDSGSASAPGSPRSGRFSPRKTHLTNFISQNAPPEVPPRKAGAVEGPPQPPQSPQLQLNGRRLQSPTASPLGRRRFRSQSPRPTPAACCESDSDDSVRPHQGGGEGVGVAGVRGPCLPEIARLVLYDEADFRGRREGAPPAAVGYCPQSEPLKRKVYKGSSSFERLKKSLDLESEIPKQALLAKINNLRRERQSSATKLSASASARSSSHDLNHAAALPGHEPGHDDDDAEADASVASSLSSKKQLILSTIEDLKRSLENQSVELNGLNED